MGTYAHKGTGLQVTAWECWDLKLHAAGPGASEREGKYGAAHLQRASSKTTNASCSLMGDVALACTKPPRSMTCQPVAP